MISQNFAPSWLSIGTFSNKLYALVFKASNKSLFWYNVPAFKAAGVKAPKTLAQLLTTAKTLLASGTPAYSIGGSDGWTLTDLFENIYLRTFGQAKYDQLAAHKIKWTDPSVITALKTMAQDPRRHVATSRVARAARSSTASTTRSRTRSARRRRRRSCSRRDFVSGVILSSTKAKAGTGFNVAPFPSITPGADSTAVEISGDLFVTFRDNPAIEAFVKFLATAPAANAWAKQGGFATGNHNVGLSVYPDAIDKANQAGRRHGEVRRLRHVGRAARVVRLDHGPGRMGHLPDVPEEPEQRHRHRQAARDGGDGGVQEGQVAR